MNTFVLEQKNSPKKVQTLCHFRLQELKKMSNMRKECLVMYSLLTYTSKQAFNRSKPPL